MEEKVVRSSEYLTQGSDGLSLSPLVTDPAASRPSGGKGVRWPLSLSPLVTDPAASRPPGERECGGLSLSLSHRWSLIWPHPVRWGKGRKCIVSPFDGTEAERRNLRYMPFSLTKLWRGRAYATCSQIPPTAAHLVTSRRPPGIPSGLAPLPVFPRRCMWIFHSSLPKT